LPFFWPIDGTDAGSPAMRTSYSGIGDRWVAGSLIEIAPKHTARTSGTVREIWKRIETGSAEPANAR